MKLKGFFKKRWSKIVMFNLEKANVIYKNERRE
jgi:hypothetical protein